MCGGSRTRPLGADNPRAGGERGSVARSPGMATLQYRATVTVSGADGRGGSCSRSFRGSCELGVSPRARGPLARRALAYLRAAGEGRPPDDAPLLAVTAPAAEPRLLLPARLAALPPVEAALRAAGAAYGSVKASSALAAWALGAGEAGLALLAPAARLAAPADRALVAALDAVARRLPPALLPPAALYSETRSFVLRRADSVKQLGSAVLDSRVTAATAQAVDRALATADRVVDRLLPPDACDAADGAGAAAPEAEGGGRACAAAAVQHGALLRRKLTRRLTRQALAEAKAIREQIHVLAYAAELVRTDPARAWQEARRLYAALSLPEPENQARPATLEELAVLLTREAARGLVHLLNYAHSDLPRNVRRGLALASAQLAAAADAVLAAPALQAALGEARSLRARMQRSLQALLHASNDYLEQLAMLVAGNEEREKLPPRAPRAPRALP